MTRVSLKTFIHKITCHILEVTLPQSCINCKKPGNPLCDLCKEQACGRSLCCVLCNFRNDTGALCRGCVPKGSRLSRVICVGTYDNILKNAVRELKYRRHGDLARPLGELLAQQFTKWNRNDTVNSYVVVPIPLHPAKEKTRGFNQALLLGKRFSEITGIALYPELLKKIKDTSPQARTASRAERILNMRNAFVADFERTKAFQEKTIILIDDVTTTGATLLDAARALSEAGATKIVGLVLAHG